MAAAQASSRNRHVRKVFFDLLLVPHKRCQFMGGMGISEMCGEPSVEGYSYCAEHFALCYTKR